MNCRHANRLMDEVLNGTREESAEFRDHLAQCAACAAQWARLGRLAAAARAEFRDTADEEQPERVSAAVLKTLEAEPTPTPALVPLWARAVAACLLLMAVFSVGLAVGRCVWPREVFATRVVEKRVPVVRTVERRVEVTKERVVVRRVPAAPTQVLPKATVAPPPSRPVTVEEVSTTAPVMSFLARPIIAEEWAPVTLQESRAAAQAETKSLARADRPGRPVFAGQQHAGAGETARAQKEADDAVGHATVAER